MTRFSSYLRPYTFQELRTAALTFAGYVFVAELAWIFTPPGVQIYPAAAIALAGFFFGGMRMTPFVAAAALIVALRNHAPLLVTVAYPIFTALQASAGAYLLRREHIDPLFRRYRDTFYFIGISMVTATIVPLLSALVGSAFGYPVSTLTWWRQWVAMETSLLVITPFILRWFAKPRFNRSVIEGVELVVVFSFLIALSVLIFPMGVSVVLGIPLVYFLLIPLFWIALRLRPRFITLALLLLALFAVGSLLAHPRPDLAARMYEVDLFLIVLSIFFYTIVSLEEDRRVSTNVMRSQVSMLENAVARISSESNAKNDFIAILAHELRNPLAPVMSGIDLLKLKPGRDQEELDTLDIMEDRMNTIRRLLDDLLDISRISEGKIALKREPLELEGILRRAIISTEHYIKERHQTLALKLPKRKEFVLGDPVRLEQVFSNLITNASKYTHPGDTITVSMQLCNEQTVEVIVSDHGIGIHPKDLEAIFVPFHQADGTSHNKKGLGIGLALVRSFVEMHDGTVTAKSAGKGKGSQFIVHLPLYDLAERPLTDTTTELQAPTHHNLLVLVVDDNDAAAAGIGRLLELRGCRVMYAYDGGQAIDQTIGHSPNVVLLDVGLPDRDGYEVARLLRERGYTGRLIALTGFSTEEAKERGKRAGFDHYLVKPAGFADLKRVIPELG
ncbi:MAG: ATP-binding protein [Bacillota bacterium]